MNQVNGKKKICDTKQCTIPKDAQVGSKIKITVTGDGTLFSGVRTSDATIVAGSEDETSELPPSRQCVSDASAEC